MLTIEAKLQPKAKLLIFLSQNFAEKNILTIASCFCRCDSQLLVCCYNHGGND